MGTIKAYVDYNDSRKQHYYENFDIIDELPEIGEELSGYGLNETATVKKIELAHLDCEQPNNEVYNYDYYEMYVNVYDSEYDENNNYTYYVCIDKEKNSLDKYYEIIKKEN